MEDREDPVAVEVHRMALQNLTNDMGITLVRTSGSPVVTDSMDFCTCLLDAEGEQLSLSSYLLAHSGSSLLGTQAVINLLRERGEEPQPGDGWLLNDPHTTGAMHQGDMAVISPVFAQGQHVAWVFSNVHVLDIGGTGVSGIAPSAFSMYDEGMRFTAIKAIHDGELDPEWIRYIAANCRAPAVVLNDLRSMHAANNAGAVALADIVDRYGFERHERFSEIGKDMTENLLRSRIAAMPDGEFESVEFVEYDGRGDAQLVEVRCTLKVEGSDLTFAFSAGPQINSFSNAGMGAVYGATMLVILTTLGYGDLPFNAGMWRPITIDLGPSGTIINPTEPVPVSLGHAEAGGRATALVKETLNQALALSSDDVLRARVAGIGSDNPLLAGLFGTDDSGSAAVVFYMDASVGTGGPAQSIMDGQDCYGMTMMAGCGLPDVEVYESTDPVVFLWRRIRQNSGGPGQTRGGQGTDRAYVLRGADELTGWNNVDIYDRSAVGFGGGFAGGGGAQYPIRDADFARATESQRQIVSLDELGGVPEDVPAKEGHFSLRRGDVMHSVGPGGSGLGDPLVRAAAEVALDVRAAYISREHAQNAYGVVLAGDLSVDEAATTAERDRIRTQRVGGTPTSPLLAPATPGVSVILASSGGSHSWACGHCDAVLADASADWRQTGTVVTEESATDRYGRFGMQIHHRIQSPRIIVRDFYCPSCAACLHTDVLPEGVTYRSPRLRLTPSMTGAVPEAEHATR
jgi:N-methylhydantoinase B